MNAEIFIVGKPKTPFIKAGIKRYITWIKPYLNLNINIIEAVNKKSKSIDETKRIESESILKNLEKDSRKVLLDVRGELRTSSQFATFIKTWQNSGREKLNFIIGGAFGFSKEIYEKNWKRLSLSPMTLTHEMALLFLLEQIYRAETIIVGKSYHY
ncbi:MAG: 23S rRNA (pseudouridine(1915)-N(3))-methyltransferase RlmH [Thermotogota bacterium]|nr:23S rRNA (pseudouridine(1915)-N(3))-methyltransferase RlmH [Thermotogota bacterium]